MRKKTLKITDILEILKKNILGIIILTAMGAAVSFIVAVKIIQPSYSSQTQLLVTLPKGDVSTVNISNVNMNIQLITTFKDLIQGDLVADSVQKKMKNEHNITLDTASIKKALTVNQANNSQMFSIQAMTSDAELSAELANTTTNVFKEVAEKYMNVESIAIISNAKKSDVPAAPNKKLFLLIGLAVGFIIGIAFALIRDLMETTVKDKAFIEEQLGYPIFGVIPKLDASEKENIATRKKTKSRKRKRKER
ncbi:chain length determinant protein [Enterococcus faecalis 13-SD-W-01]|nr:chain length determinant protein [Enterococcus faecalis 13-SD-W-01]